MSQMDWTLTTRGQGEQSRYSIGDAAADLGNLYLALEAVKPITPLGQEARQRAAAALDCYLADIEAVSSQ